jgi:hypothetical protein
VDVRSCQAYECVSDVWRVEKTAWAYGAREQAIGERVGRGGSSDTDRAMGSAVTCLFDSPCARLSRGTYSHGPRPSQILLFSNNKPALDRVQRRGGY